MKSFWKQILAKATFLFHWFLKLSVINRAIIIIVLLVLGYFVESQTVFKKSNAPQYQTAQVEKGTLISNVTASGNISTGNSVNITTAATGVVSQVYVKNGDSVVAGQKIADIVLDQDSQQRQAAAYASYLSSQNNLNSSQAKINSLQSALFKANQIFINDRGIINPSTDQKNDPKYIEENADWLQAEADYKNQTGVISAAQASLSSASLSYAQSSSTITSPVAGTITNLTISQGSPISKTSQSSGTSSNSIATQSLGAIHIEGGALQASVNLSEIDVSRVAVGQKVTLTLSAYPDKTFTGKISAIDTSGAISAGVTNYPAVITLDQTSEKIYPNMAVDTKIITDVKDNVLLVPSTSVQSQNGQASVRVMKIGQVTNASVETGLFSDTQTEIISGLSEGDVVVTSIITPTTATGQTGASPFGGGGGFGALRGGFGGGGGGGGGANRGGASGGR